MVIFRRAFLNSLFISFLALVPFAEPVSAMGSLDWLTGRDSMGDKDKFQWKNRWAHRDEAIRLGVIQKEDNFPTDKWDKFLEQMVASWFPIGTPIEEMLPYFEGHGFSYGLDNYGDRGYNEDLAAVPQGPYYWFRLDWRVGILGSNLITMYLGFDPKDSEKRSKRILVITRFYRGI